MIYGGRRPTGEPNASPSESRCIRRASLIQLAVGRA